MFFDILPLIPVILLTISISSVLFLPRNINYIVGLSCWCIPIVVLIIIRIIYRGRIARRYSFNHNLTGKTILITGGTNGIGFHTAVDLARRNAKAVIITGRDENKGQEACRAVQSLSGNSNVYFMVLELSELESVRQFARSIASNFPVIDILINNAACSLTSHIITSYGVEKTMAANYFGPVLLTESLLPNIKASEQGRIINLSSVVYKFGKLDLNNLDFKENFAPFLVYATSKLANLLYTRCLARSLHKECSKVTVNAVHPGIVNTGLFREAPAFLKKIMVGLIGFLFKGGEEGAQTTIFCSVEPDLSMVSGVYFEDCCANFNLLPIGKDDDLGERLWNKTRTLCSLDKKSD